MKVKLQKSPQAFRTISEVSEELKLPSHVLRFWETKFSQIQPLKRSGGRRYYRPKDIELLLKIKNLLYENGYTLKGVMKLLNNRLESATIDIQKDETEDLETKEDKDQIPFSFNQENKLEILSANKKFKDELKDILSEIDKLITKYS